MLKSEMTALVLPMLKLKRDTAIVPKAPKSHPGPKLGIEARLGKFSRLGIMDLIKSNNLITLKLYHDLDLWFEFYSKFIFY